MTHGSKRSNDRLHARQPCILHHPGTTLSKAAKMKKTLSKAAKLFNGNKKAKEDENVSSITPAQLREMRGMIPHDYQVQEANGATLEHNQNTPRRLIVHYDSVKMGWHFPLHPLLVEICNRYAIPPDQISSNSHESLFCFLARCHMKGIQPTLGLFLSFFRHHKYDTPEDLPFPNIWRKKEDKFPSHTFPSRTPDLEEVFRLLLKNGHPVPRALLSKDSYFRGLGFWVSPDVSLQALSGNTTSSWAPPLRTTRFRKGSRRSSRRDLSPEEDSKDEDVGSAAGDQPLPLANHPFVQEEVVVEDVSDDGGLYDFPPGILRGSNFNHRLQEIQQFWRDHPDVVDSPTWSFMLEEYTRMTEYVATSATQRHSLRLLDRNAALSQELGNFRSQHSICVER
ncbi:unnamed protein product [Cuscuta campestris]|uniref:Uncharacterized protein n=1 Tax=Cuscuta campestris TaxID=132261 RepID=A0A484L588_9ASTE|nr:unnamed protein product [Cuscuta campestris]